MLLIYQQSKNNKNMFSHLFDSFTLVRFKICFSYF